MAYKYLIIDTFDGIVKGTNDDEKATKLSTNWDGHLVIRASDETQLIDGQFHAIPEFE